MWKGKVEPLKEIKENKNKFPDEKISEKAKVLLTKFLDKNFIIISNFLIYILEDLGR